MLESTYEGETQKTSELPILVMPVKSGSKNKKITAVMDTGSNITLINKDALTEIDYEEGETTNESITTVSDSLHEKLTKVTIFPESKRKGTYFPLQVIAKPDVSVSIPQRNTHPFSYDENLNGEYPRDKTNLSLIISVMDMYKFLAANPEIKGNGIIKWKTIYGNVYSGMLDTQGMYFNLTYSMTNEDLGKMIQQLWENENLPGDLEESEWSEEQTKCYNKLRAQLQWNPKLNKFQCGLLLKDKINLKNNYERASTRLRSFMRKVNSDPEIAEVWNEKFKELLDNDVIVESKDDPLAEGKVYMGFTLVHRPYSTTTKWRLCTDASIKTPTKPIALSLNDNIMDAPNLCNYLRSIELLSRAGHLYFAGDIKKIGERIRPLKSSLQQQAALWQHSGGTIKTM